MKRILWFSRHPMTEEQRSVFGDAEIVQIDRTINSAFELKEDIEQCDIIAIVAPIHIQKQFLQLAGDKPVIMALNDRVLIQQHDGSESKVAFQFVKWERLVKIEVIKEDFVF